MDEKGIAFFDFDGTITNKDSLIDFVQFAVGKSSFYFGLFLLSPMLLCYSLKLIPNYIAKEKLIAHFFKGWRSSHFKKLANLYSLEQVDKIIRISAIERIDWHIKNNHKVVVVSASIDCWLEGWCDKKGIALVSTKLEVKDNIVTGKFATKNCYGIEKVNRIKELYDLSEYDEIYAFGDSKGDKEMLSIANERYYRFFN